MQLGIYFEFKAYALNKLSYDKLMQFFLIVSLKIIRFKNDIGFSATSSLIIVICWSGGGVHKKTSIKEYHHPKPISKIMAYGEKLNLIGYWMGKKKKFIKVKK